MASINKLSIRGVRSFSPDDAEQVSTIRNEYNIGALGNVRSHGKQEESHHNILVLL